MFDPLEGWMEEQVIAFHAAQDERPDLSVEAFLAELGLRQPERSRADLGRLEERLGRVAQLGELFAESSAPDWAEGEVVGDFLLEQLIGHGGMGRVFRASDRRVERKVALKASHWVYQASPKDRLRFRREAEVIALLDHPGIVRLLQVGEHRGVPFLAMEYVPGESLEHVIQGLCRRERAREGASLGRPGRSYAQAVAEVGIEILEALEYAHGQGVVHRDIKPSNVLLQGDGRLRVVDFGIAKVEGKDSLSGSRELLGTLDYLAPEAIDSPRAGGPWSDLYSVGVLLYELVTLSRPFRGESPAEVLARIQEGDPESARRRAGVPRDLSAVLECAMLRDPARRYGSAGEFRDDLQRFVRGDSVAAKPQGILGRMGRRIRRHPAVSFGLGFLLLSLVALAAVTADRDVVLASLNDAESKRLCKSALLWSYSDADQSGGGSVKTGYRLRAAGLQAEALAKSSERLESRVDRAVLELETRQPEAAAATIRGLEAYADDHRVVGWLQECLEQGLTGSGFFRVPALDAGSVASPIDRYYLARAALQRPDPVACARICRTLLDHEIYQGPAYYLIGISNALRKNYHPEVALRYYQASEVLMGEHPVLLANFGMLLTEMVMRVPKSSRKAKHEDDLQLAKSLLDRAVTLAPSYRPGHLNRTYHYWRRYGPGERTAATVEDAVLGLPHSTQFRAQRAEYSLSLAESAESSAERLRLVESATEDMRIGMENYDGFPYAKVVHVATLVARATHGLPVDVEGELRPLAAEYLVDPRLSDEEREAIRQSLQGLEQD